MKKIFGTILIAMVTSIATLVIARNYSNSKNHFFTQNGNYSNPEMKLTEASYTSNSPEPDGGGYTNLEQAAEISSKAVVHIKTEIKSRAVQYNNPMFDDFFGNFFGDRNFQQQPQQGSGSGVIISRDGYIVTNNHVVEGADEVTVILNNKKNLKAKVIGNDPSTDLAVLKVEEPNLPYLNYGNSDDVKLGQWVLAVGYPLTLETTVTAGIVSAKYRNIGIGKSKGNNNSIESFIQTDAAVNPGNSGGALVNSKGELIGINSAIASPTGSYAGYSFAIPSNIVKKVVSDMIEYGNVQRAYLGVGILSAKDASPEEVTRYNLDKVEGVYIKQVNKGSSAENAGLKEGDFITRIEDKDLKTTPQLMEKIAQYRPGDVVTINYLRNGKAYTTKAELKNISGNSDIVKASMVTTDKLGIQVRDLSNQELKSVRLKNGVLVSNVSNGLVAKQTRIRPSFIITQINDQDVFTTSDIDKILASGDTEFQITGKYPNLSNFYVFMVRTN